MSSNNAFIYFFAAVAVGVYFHKNNNSVANDPTKRGPGYIDPRYIPAVAGDIPQEAEFIPSVIPQELEMYMNGY